MSIRLQLPKITELKPRITVIGVGGAGGNAINNMIASGLEGVEFIAANTDAQALALSSAEHRIQLGVNLTEGLGAGSKPEVGEAAAEEALEDIRSQIKGSHMVFVAAGMGGGTGTGAAAVIARAAKELGILVVGVVTKPFQFEGARRMRMAEAGIAELKQQVDTLIVIPNQNLFRLANEKTTFADAFVLADQVLYSGIACIVDLIVKDGLINLDFADVRTVMKNMGTAMMGTGEGSGERRAVQAAEEAITNPLLDNISLRGARGLLLSIIGGRNMTLYEVDEAASRVRQEVDPEANIIVGASFDDTLGDRVRVSIVASGMEKSADETALQAQAPNPLRAGSHLPWPRPAVPLATGPAAQPILSMSPRPANSGPATARELQQHVAQAIAPHNGQHGQSPMPYAAAAEDGESPFDLGPAMEVASPVKAETWRAPGNVVIEQRLPQLAPKNEPQREKPPLPHGEAAHRNEPFAPAAPVNGHRQPRRMPEVTDFPLIGQREYLAKAGASSQFGQPPAAIRQSEQRALPPAPPAVAPRKRGFLARLTGRRDPDSAASPQPSRPTQHLVQVGRPPEAQLTRLQNPGQPTGHPTGRSPQQAPAEQGNNQEDIELPMFFHRESK